VINTKFFYNSSWRIYRRNTRMWSPGSFTEVFLYWTQSNTCF